MDNSSKQQKEGEGGQIFQSGEKSAYEEAVFSPGEDVNPNREIYQEPQPADAAVREEVAAPDQNNGGTPPGGEGFAPPPPFVEDPRRKFLFIAIFIILLLAGGFFLFRVLSSRNKPPPKVAQEKVTLTYWGLWEDEPVMRTVIDSFQKENKLIEIKYLRQDPTDFRERLQAAIDRGEGPDIYRFHNSWTPMMVKYLAPLPKDVYSDEEYKKTFYPVTSRDLLIGGNFYGIPLEIDGLMLYYNEDILKGAGVAVPKNWVEVQDAVPKLTVKEESRVVTSAIALGTAENIEHFSDILSLMMLQNGTKLDTSLLLCTDTKTTTCGIESLAFYRNFAATPNNTWDDSLENSIVAFAGGKVAMIFAPSWQAHVINQINPDLKFKTAKVPQLPCNVTPCPEVNWATYWVEGVSVKSTHAKESWQFLKYLTSKEVQQKLYAEESKVRNLFGEPYSRVDLGESLKDNVYLSPLIEMAPTMQSSYATSRTNDGETGLNSSLVEYLKNAVNSLKEHGVSEETAITTADNGFKEVYKRFNIAPAQ